MAPATLTVTLATDTGSVGELRTVIGQANAGDTIVFGSQIQGDTITLTQGPIRISQSSLTIDGGSRSISISGGSSSRIFEVTTGTDTINNLTFMSGKVTGANGGAILLDGGATLTLNTDTFSSNQAVDSISTFASGGAIEDDGILTVNSCTFSGNKAGASGGAIDTAGDSAHTVKLTVTNSTFALNQATDTLSDGGAIDSTAAICNIQTSSFTGNSAGIAGGAIDYVISNTNTPATEYDTTLAVNEDTFTNNSANGGGAISELVDTNDGTVTSSITCSTFSMNSAATFNGGAVKTTYSTSGTGAATATLVNDTFFKNTSANYGGALYLSMTNSTSNSAELTSLTVFQNQATNAGGGVYLDTMQGVTVDNDIIDGNTVTVSGYTGPLDVTLANSATLNWSAPQKLVQVV